MTRLSPAYIFIGGSLILALALVLFYYLVPPYEYFRGDHAIYAPGSASPEAMEPMMECRVSNHYLIAKFGRPLGIYLVSFVLVYLALARMKQFVVLKRYVWVHLSATALSFILMVFLNPYIVFPGDVSGPLSDVYIGAEFPQEILLQGNQQILWYKALATPTTVLGMGFCVVGVGMFLLGIYRGQSRA